MSDACLAQAVVTDPQRGHASGYALVAASSGLSAADAESLAGAPQVTDHLHTAAAPGPYLSFFALPSGRWALSRRFVHGRRRGSFHRVVAHTLVVPPAVLEAVDDDPWLLVARCRYRAVGGGELVATLGEWGQRLAEVEPGTPLDDLVVEAPENPQAMRAESLERRRSFLAERWGSDRLDRSLEAIFAALADGRRLLLAQDGEHEQLLALATAALPPADRRGTGWTTHLAVDAAGSFAIANTVEPEAARRQLDPAQGWSVTSEAPRCSVAVALASAVRESDPFPPALDAACRRWGLALRDGGAALDGWLAWHGRGGEAALRGFDDARALGALLARLPLDRAVPWCRPEHVLAMIVGTVLRHPRALGGDPLGAIVEIEAVVGSRVRPGTDQATLAALESFVGGDVGGHGADGQVVGVAWTAAGIDAAGRGRSAREAVLESLPAPGLANPALVVPVRCTLWNRLLAEGSAKATAALAALAAEAGGLEAALSPWTGSAARPPEPDDLTALGAVLDAAAEASLPRSTAAGCVIALVLDHPDLATEPDADATLSRALAVAPAAAVHAALRSPNEAIASATLAALRDRLGAGDLEAVAALDQLGRDTGAAVPETPELTGLTAIASAAGVTPSAWLRVAAAEATVLDRAGAGREAARARSTFVRSAASVAPPAAAIPRQAETILQSMLAAARGGWLGPAQLGLLRGLPALLASRPADAENLVAALGVSPTAHYVALGEVVAAASTMLAERGQGESSAALRRRWWLGLAGPKHRWSALPDPVIAMLEVLPIADRNPIAHRFVSKIDGLDDEPGNRRVLASLAAAARADAALALRYDVLDARRAGADLVSAVAARLGVESQPEALVASIVHWLPTEVAPRAAETLRLVLSERLPPSLRRAIEQRLVPKALAGDGWLAGLPPVAALATRPTLLRRLAKRAGASADSDASSMAFFDDLVAHGADDAVCAFVEAAPEDFVARWVRQAEPGGRRALAAARRAPVRRWSLAAVTRRLAPLDHVAAEGLAS